MSARTAGIVKLSFVRYNHLIISVLFMLITLEATYSNLENHPRLIRARDNRPVPKIRLDPRTGLPVVVEEAINKRKTNVAPTPTPALDSSALTDESDGGGDTRRE